jgi:hypothetical protein
MGASEWSYVVPLDADVASAFLRLRERVFAEGDYYWPDRSRPATLAELDASRERPEFWETGTHSILDVDRLIDSDHQDEEGTVRPLSEEDARDVFGTATPTRREFDEAWRSVESTRLWSGQYLVLFDDKGPAEVAFWGWSGA